jgi:hypothetical protein
MFAVPSPVYTFSRTLCRSLYSGTRVGGAGAGRHRCDRRSPVQHLPSRLQRQAALRHHGQRLPCRYVGTFTSVLCVLRVRESLYCYNIYPAASDKLPYVTMGSGSLAAVSVRKRLYSKQYGYKESSTSFVATSDKLPYVTMGGGSLAAVAVR